MPKKERTDITKELLEELYIRQQLTTYEIGKIINASHDCIRRYLHKFGIPIRTTGCRKGTKHPKWHGGKIFSKGYIKIYDPTNVMADSNGYVFEHRLVMSNHLGRPLASDEFVHHINENKTDNHLENLQLTNLIDHQIHHHTKISLETVKKIREEYRPNTPGKGTYALAKKYGISQSRVYLIVINKIFICY